MAIHLAHTQVVNIDLHLFSCFWTSNWMTSGRIGCSTFLVLKVPHILILLIHSIVS